MTNNDISREALIDLIEAAGFTSELSETRIAFNHGIHTAIRLIKEHTTIIPEPQQQVSADVVALLHDIKTQAQRKLRASSVKHLLEGDLNIIERKAELAIAAMGNAKPVSADVVELCIGIDEFLKTSKDEWGSRSRAYLAGVCKYLKDNKPALSNASATKPVLVDEFKLKNDLETALYNSRCSVGRMLGAILPVIRKHTNYEILHHKKQNQDRQINSNALLGLGREPYVD